MNLSELWRQPYWGLSRYYLSQRGYNNMQFQLGLELRARCNEDAIVSWQQLLNLLESENATDDLCEDVAEVILNLKDILLVLDGEAD